MKIDGIEHPPEIYESLVEHSEQVAPICTCVRKRGHHRRLRNGAIHWFADEICDDVAVVEAYNPLTGDVYHCCRTHWTDEALHAADRMGLKYRKVKNEQDA